MAMGKYVGSHRIKAMEELERGRDFANQLLRQFMSFKSSKGQHGLELDVADNDGAASTLTTPSAEDLVANVVASFTNTLLLLNHSNNGSHGYDHQTFHNVSDSSSWIPSKSDDSQHSISSKSKSSPVNDRRGCHKRRKSSHTWEQDSGTSTTEDGYAWRKYGQKMILNTKHPRNYFRCTHKFDQGCQATKQVQRIQDEPPLYRTTYYGHHTCRNLQNPEIILDSPVLSNTSILLSFDDDNNNNNSISNRNTLPNPFLPSFSPNPIKKEEQCCNVKQEKTNIPSSSSNDYLLSPYELTFESHRNHGDVNSSAVFYDPPLHHDDLDALTFDPYINFDELL